jgi:TrmH family RNA methyltransferase
MKRAAGEKHMESGGVAFEQLAGRTAVVLVGTLYGGNVGSTARVMNNFGFADLRLAEARAGIDDDARRMAVHSEPVLDGARTFGSLADALADADVAIGTSRRAGRRRARRFDAPEMAKAIRTLPAGKRIALVFGPEDAGLSNEHLDRCDWLVTIPAGSRFDSLNLSHAAAVVLYEIHRSYLADTPERSGDSQLLGGLFDRLEATLRGIGFLNSASDPKRVMIALRRMIERGKWSRSEIKLFHAILNYIDKR